MKSGFDRNRYMDMDENAEINDLSDERTGRMAVSMYGMYPLQSNQLLDSTVIIQKRTIGKREQTQRKNKKVNK